MNKRIYHFIFFIGLIFPVSISAQSFLSIEAAQVFSTFKYIDSQGDVDNTYSYNVLGSYSLGYQNTKQNGFFIRANIGMRKAGANLVYNNSNYIWNMQYTDLKAGIGYQFNKWRIKPSVAVSPYYAFLLNANQTINDNNYDIKNNKSIKDSDFGVIIAPGLNVILSNYISIYAEYNYILGLQNIETADLEELYNRGFSLNFGVAFNITKIAKINQPRIVQ